MNPVDTQSHQYSSYQGFIITVFFLQPPLLTKEVYPKLPKDDDLHTDTNPLYWSIDDVITFLKTTDCSHLARIIKEQVRFLSVNHTSTLHMLNSDIILF